MKKRSRGRPKKYHDKLHEQKLAAQKRYLERKKQRERFLDTCTAEQLHQSIEESNKTIDTCKEFIKLNLPPKYDLNKERLRKLISKIQNQVVRLRKIQSEGFFIYEFQKFKKLNMSFNSFKKRIEESTEKLIERGDIEQLNKISTRYQACIDDSKKFFSKDLDEDTLFSAIQILDLMIRMYSIIEIELKRRSTN